MSWQAYVDTNLLGTGKIAKAAILGQAGGVWATSGGFTIDQEEARKIIAGFTSSRETVQTSGVVVAGTKYFTIQANDRSIYGKKGADGVVIVKTKQAVLVAVYKPPVQAPEATPIVEVLADYLISVGY